MFANLLKEMKNAQPKITQATLARTLGLTTKAICERFNNKAKWTRNEMFKIRDTFFPTKQVDYLFETI